LATPHKHGSSTCPAERSMTGRTCAESSSTTSRARTPVLTSNGICATASNNRGNACATTSAASPSVALSFPV
jgi:hypothetical protein